ncbi:MAG: fimbrial protein, partial [Fermentimonas sp.]
MMKDMFTYNKTKWLLMLCMAVGLSIFFSSCNDEMVDFPDATTDLPGDGYLLEIPVEIVNQKTLLSTNNLRAGNDKTEEGDFDKKSYETDPLNENKIDELDLFIFMEGNVKGHYSTANKTLLHDATAKTAKVRIEKNTADALEGKEVQVYLIANAKADLSGITTLEGLKGLVQKDVLSPAPDNEGKVAAQKNFLMDGM